MRLIDADALVAQEEFFAKTFKGDFGEQVATHVIEIVNDAPTVDAIPIEWILDYKDKYTVITSEECDPVKSEVIADMLADWAERKAEYVTLHHEDIHFIDEDAERAFYESLAERKEE